MFRNKLIRYFSLIILIFLAYSLADNTANDVLKGTKQNTLSSDANKDMNTTSSSKRRGKNIYGLLGFLTGYRFAQGIGPTSYHSDIRDSAQLNLFSTLFDGALQLSYVKYPYMFPFVTLPTLYNPNVAYPQQTQNLYSPNLQAPILYPPLSNQGVGLPNYDLENQQQNKESNLLETIGNDQFLNLIQSSSKPVENDKIGDKEPNRTVNLGVKESLNSNKTQKERLNNKILKSQVFEKISSSRENAISIDSKLNQTEVAETTKNVYLKPELTEQDSDDVILKLASNSVATKAFKNLTEPDITKDDSSNNTKPVSVSVDFGNITQLEKDKSSNGTVADEVSHNSDIPSHNTEPSKNHNSTNNTVHKPSFYPYPYYHYFENSSKYDQISITESPMSHPNYLKQQDFYEETSNFDNNYLNHNDGGFNDHFEEETKLDDPVPGPYYNPDSQYYDNNNVFEKYYPQEKFNKKQEESGFVPLGTLKHIK